MSSNCASPSRPSISRLPSFRLGFSTRENPRPSRDGTPWPAFLVKSNRSTRIGPSSVRLGSQRSRQPPGFAAAPDAVAGSACGTGTGARPPAEKSAVTWAILTWGTRQTRSQIAPASTSARMSESVSRRKAACSSPFAVKVPAYAAESCQLSPSITQVDSRVRPAVAFSC